jgi:quercetin dioxygenase-like cupin family protein
MDVPQLAPDDPARDLVAVDPDDPALTHLGVVGDTYTILVTGEQTGGRFAVIDMLVPPGGGPPPHRHAFDEMFHVLEGEIAITFRDRTVTATAGQTASIPANAPHRFANTGSAPARLLCTVAPAGLERFFAEWGDPVASRTAPAPRLDDAALGERLRRGAELQARYGIETLA